MLYKLSPDHILFGGLMFDSSRHIDFAQRFAVVATSDNPERVRTMTGGLSLVHDAMRSESRESLLHMATILREAVQEGSSAWTVVRIPRWQPEDTHVGGLYYALVPTEAVPKGVEELTSHIPGMRVFFFGFDMERENNCMLCETGDVQTMFDRTNPVLRLWQDLTADAELHAQLHRYAVAAVGVTEDLIETAERQFGEQPHPRRHFEALREYVKDLEKGINTVTITGAVMRLIPMIALALDMKVSDVFAMIEERLPSNAS